MYRKELFYRGLDQLPVYIEDTLQNSPYYFNIVEIPKVFGPGKNSIRFNLNENNLDIYNNVDVEIIDSYGATVYHEAPEYSQNDEENIKVLTVFLYDNISNGPLRITFIGHAKAGLNGEEIPEEFKDKYNVRYTTIVDFNRFQKNTSRILFSQDPSILISEARTAYVSRSLSPLDTVTVSGSGIYRYQQSYPLLEIPQAQSFTNDMLNGTLVLTGSSILPDFSGYITSSFNIFNSRISNIYNSQVAILNIPWTASILGQGSSPSYGVVNNANVNYTLTYSPTPNYTPINNFKSFINLKISNLDPASGYLKYIKLYGKSQGSLDQYELLGESQTIDNELLINSSSYTQYDRSNVGYFLNSSSFQSFWNYNDTYLSASFNTSSLFNSLYLNPQVDTATTNVLFTSNIDINFQKGSSYRLYFNYVKNTNFVLEVYMSGSAFINKEGNGQRVFYLDSSNFGPSYLNLPIDFLAPQTGTGRLQFKILAGSFYISDISLKSGVDQGFNPSNFNSYFPINVKNRDDVYDFKVDFIDDNNQINSYEFDNTGASNIQVSGSNQYISGCDNLIPGCIRLGNSLQQGIHLDGQNNQVTTYNNSTGWVMWSGSQTISGSSQPGSGFYFETGAPYNHYIKATVGGQIQISGSVVGATGGTTIDTGSFVTTSSFNNFTSSINNFTSSINNATSSFATTGSNSFIGNQIITGSLANGFNTIASGSYSHAEGGTTTAQGDWSHSEGIGTTANGYYSHAEGLGTIANGFASHAEGSATIANADYSHAEGIGTIASGSGQTVVGKYNKQNNTSSLFIIGNGVDSSNRSDLVLFNESSVEISGSLIVNNQTLPAINTLILSTQTGSFVTTGSVDKNILTFTKGNGTTFNLTVDTGSVPTIDTGSFVTTSSFNSYTSSINSSISSINIFTGSIRDTNLGTTSGYPGGKAFISPGDYSKPSGYQEFVVKAGSTGIPAESSGYLAYNVIGRRDIDGGYFATLSEESNIWFTYNLTSSVYPTWTKIQTTNAFNAATSSFVTTSSFNTYTSSINSRTGSFVTTSSFNSYTSSVQSAINSIGGKANLTGGNSFSGDQTISGSIEFTAANSAITSNIKFTDIDNTSAVTLYRFNADRFRAAFGDMMITDQNDASRLEMIRFSIALQNGNIGVLDSYSVITSSADLTDIALSTDISTLPNVNIIATVTGGDVYTARVSNVHLLAN